MFYAASAISASIQSCKHTVLALLETAGRGGRMGQSLVALSHHRFVIKPPVLTTSEQCSTPALIAKQDKVWDLQR